MTEAAATLSPVERLQQGLPFRRDLFRLVRNILRNAHDTEDVLQDVWLAAVLAVQECGVKPEDLKRYLSKMARNRALDVKRRRRLEVSLDVLLAVEAGA